MPYPPPYFNVKMRADSDSSNHASVREEIHVDNASRNDSHASPLLQEANNEAVATQGQVTLEVKIRFITPQMTGKKHMRFGNPQAHSS
jgi:hypothetical protein